MSVVAAEALAKAAALSSRIIAAFDPAELGKRNGRIDMGRECGQVALDGM